MAIREGASSREVGAGATALVGGKLVAISVGTATIDLARVCTTVFAYNSEITVHVAIQGAWPPRMLVSAEVRGLA